MSSSRLKGGLAKGLGIKLDNQKNVVSRGESVMSNQTVDTYVEQDPTPAEYLREITPNGKDILHYIYQLFPFTHWIGRYNLQWFSGDLVAGQASSCSVA